MAHGFVYLRSHCRRPVRLGGSCFGEDPQTRLPLGWCEHCGAEVFAPKQSLCRRCVRRLRDEQE